MTEAEFLRCSDPKPLLNFLNRASDRKLRLFACACFRRIWPFFHNELAAWVVEVSERYADGQASRKELRTEYDGVLTFFQEHRGWRKEDAEFMIDRFEGVHFDDSDAERGDTTSAFAALISSSHSISVARLQQELKINDVFFWNSTEVLGQCNLVRDIFGNPFRHISLDPTWLSPAVVSFAEVIYNERSFTWMPELADALERAGCTNTDILDHCRGPGPHVRGCWVVDLILGKQ